MRLSSPAVERSLREQARRELRQSPLLWKDYRQHRTRWWRRNRNLQVAIGSLYALAVIFLVSVQARGRLALLDVVAFYASGTALFRCSSYYSRVLRGYDRAVLISLPVLDDDYLRHESRVFFRSWAGAFVIFVVAYGGYISVYGKLWRDAGTVLAAATLQTLTSVCIGMAVVVYRRRWVRAIVPFYGLMIVCLYLPENALHFLWSATLVMPAGWVAHGFAGVIGSGDSAERFWLIPAFLVSAALPLVWRRLQSQFLSDLVSPDAAFEALLAPDSEETQEQPPAVESGEIWQAIPTYVPLAAELKGSDWTRLGWIERLVAVWLTDRQRVVAEFMLASNLGAWSKKWRMAAMVTLAGTAVTLIVPSLPSWLFFLPMIAAGLMAAPVFGGSWPGFGGPFASGLVLPVYATVPIGYGEISRVMLKTSLVRALTWAPLAILYAAALSHRLGYSFEYGSAMALDIVLVLIAVQPVMVAGHFSSGTNDSRQLNWHTVSFFCFALFLLVILVVATIMTFVVPTLAVRAISLAVIFAASLAGLAAYKLLFERGRIDVLSRPRTQ